MQVVKFNKDSIIEDSIFCKRGDVFTTIGVFKSPNEKNKEDKILTKENRPVLVISNDQENKNIVRVLPFSSHMGNYDKDSITKGRLIELPRLYDKKSDTEKSYIDVTQIFTVNTYQLGHKICRLRSEVVDTAVALNTLFNIQTEAGAKIVCDYLCQKFTNLKVNKSSDNNMSNPSEDYFVSVEEKVEEKTESTKQHTYPPSSTVKECELLHQEWLSLTTDGFRYKYKLNKTQYNYLRNKCIKILLQGKRGFTRYDWKG